jgi:hypothetical protein
MTNLNLRYALLSLLAIIMCFIGCVRTDPPTPDNYSKYPLTVKFDELPDGSFRLQWNAIKSADFISYQVIRNIGDSVPYIENNKVLLGNLQIIKQLDNPDSTVFIDRITLPTTKTYLRVFAVLKERNLSSLNIEMPIKTNAKEMALEPTDVLFVPEEKRLVIADHTVNLNRLGIFNTDLNIPVVTNIAPAGITSNIFLTANSEMSVGRYNNITEFYTHSNGQILARNFTNTTFTNLSFFFNLTTSLLYQKSINLYLTISSSSFNNTTSVGINSFIRTSSTSSNSLGQLSTSTASTQQAYVFRPAPLNEEAIAVAVTNNSSHLIWFKYLNNGGIITMLKTLTTTSLPITKRPFAIAPDNQLFITGTTGLIFDRNIALTANLKLPVPNVTYNDMIFSTDGTRLYAIRNGATDRKQRLVDVFKYPNFTFERSIPFKSTPSRVFQDGTNLILVGRSPNNEKNTMIEKIAL